MKVLVVIVCSLMTMARGSLEPVGYRPPGTYPQTRYLPPSSSQPLPDNRYIPSSPSSSSSSSFDSSRQNVGKLNNELSRSLSLPSHGSSVPFSNYLPANRQTSSEHNYPSILDEQRNNLVRHRPATEIRHSLTQGTTSNDYLPPMKESQSRQAHNYPTYSQSNPDRSYLTPDEKSGHYSSGYSSHNGFPSASGSGGYNYQSKENQTPAQYDFEYEVKDNYGNDYGHKETRNGESTQGVYKVLLPDGRRQIVHYEADSHGYRPTVTYEKTDGNSLTRQSPRDDNQGYHY